MLPAHRSVESCGGLRSRANSHPSGVVHAPTPMLCSRCQQDEAVHRTLPPFVFCPDGFLSTAPVPYPAVDATDDGCSHAVAAFELMELSTGNLVGTYSTLEAALRDVAEAIRRSGASAVATLALGQDDPTGVTDGVEIARGATLADLASSGQA